MQPAIVSGVYERVTSESGLLKFLVEIHAFEIDPAKFEFEDLFTDLERLPSGFLARVLVVAYKRAESCNKLLFLVDRRCDFHEHATGVEKIDCHNMPSRQQDRDVLLQKRKTAEANAEAARVEELKKKREQNRRESALKYGKR
jgi:hypothetical protein